MLRFMTTELRDLKSRFDVALNAYVQAMTARKLALEDALVVEADDVNRCYLDACNNEERKSETYHQLASQLREALQNRGR